MKLIPSKLIENELWIKLEDHALVSTRLVKEEQEACAKLCDERSRDFYELWRKYKHDDDAGAQLGSKQCAEAIRARGKQ